MQTSEGGLSLIRKSEGFSANIYDDNGKQAIGYGHDLLPGESFAPPITGEEAETLLRKDLATRFEPAVNALIPADCTQNQFDALVDFCFNLGPANLKTMLAHGWEDVPNQIPRWNHSGGKVSPGLTARRQAEVDLFNSR
jgi:lysozyme